MGDWKAVRVKSQSAAIELYDLETDVAEKRDVAAQHPEIVARMAKLMVEGRTESREFPVVNKR